LDSESGTADSLLRAALVVADPAAVVVVAEAVAAAVQE
jgi:hypothetical protein